MDAEHKPFGGCEGRMNILLEHAEKIKRMREISPIEILNRRLDALKEMSDADILQFTTITKEELQKIRGC